MKKFAVKMSSPEISEAIQRVAFKNGYEWWYSVGKKEALKTSSPYLTFNNPTNGDHKIGSTCSSEYIEGEFDLVFDSDTQFHEIIKQLEGENEQTTDRIYVKVTPELSEALQKMAFKYGYTWPSYDQKHKVHNTDHPYLLFNRKYKWIFCNRENGDRQGYTLVSDLNEIIEFLSVTTIQFGSDICEIDKDYARFKYCDINGSCVAHNVVSFEKVKKLFDAMWKLRHPDSSI